MRNSINKRVTIDESALDFLFKNYGKMPLTQIAKYLKIPYGIMHKNVGLLELNRITRERWNKNFDADSFFEKYKL